jgi:PKD repeat protein
MKKQLFVVTTALALTLQTTSQTIINAGPVCGTWTSAGSPYHIMGDIEVPIGGVLLIEPGVTVKIFSELSFKINGQLLAEGTENDSIFFIPVSPYYWKGLQILSSLDTCKLKYCSFSNFINRTSYNYGIRGGAVHVSNSKVIINNSNFSSNMLKNYNWEDYFFYGGAIFISSSFTLIQKCNFIGNNIYVVGSFFEGAYGGAIYAVDGNITIVESQIHNNYINLNGSGESMSISTQGGGIYTSGLVQNCLIYNNYCNCQSDAYSGLWASAQADCNGGGIYGGILKDNVIYNNSCLAEASAWGIMEAPANADAQSEGGGVFDAETIENNLIYSNLCNSHATAGGSGSSVSGATSNGGGIWGGYLKNNTILNNAIQATGGTTTLLGSGVFSGTLENCIIYNNTGASQISDAGVTYSCVQGGYTGQGNISSDPLFVNPSQNDYHLKQPPCQAQFSPCVDAGDPLSPLLQGTTRTDEYPDLGTIDMGFHYGLISPIVIADFNSDINCGTPPMVVNFFDKSYQYQMDSVKYEWDFENDGIIDSNEENPIWTFNENGLKTVKQKIIGYANDTLYLDSIIKENFIIVPDEFLVSGGFTINNNYGEYPLVVNFTDTSLITPCGEINQWKWDFENDGIFDSYGQNPFWIYSEPGKYSIKLIAGNSNFMDYDTILKTDFITVCSMVPGFYAEPLSGDVPLEVDFYDTSYIEYSQISTWQWDFQHDGLIDAYGPNPTWIYPGVGIYSVELRITDTSGQIWKSVVKEDYIQVNSITGLPNESLENINQKLKIFPNPFTNDLNIEFEFDNPEVVTIQIFDIAFKLVTKIAINEKVEIGKKTWKWECQTNNLRSGIYYISLKTSSGIQSIKKCIEVN